MRGSEFVAAATFVLISATSKVMALEDSDAALLVCQAMDKTGLLSDECQANASGRVITASIDTTSDEARKICSGVVQMVAQQHRFSPPWKVRITSPYTKGSALATCQLQ